MKPPGASRAGEPETARALARAREQQAAMAEVFQLLSRSAFDLKAVLQAVVERASQLCRAQQGFVYRLEGDVYRLDVAYNITPEFLAFTQRSPIRATDRGTLTGRAGLEARPIHVPDVLKDPEYTFWEAQRLGNFRAMLSVPLIREGAVIGVIALWRTEPDPFLDDEIQLVSTFADQAVVAIEQARRAQELADALEQQTAAAEVLRIISRSTTDLQAVFEPLIQSAVRLCKADHGDIVHFDPDGKAYREAAHFGVGDEAYRAVLRARTYKPGRETLVGRTILEQRPVRIDDILADREYQFGEAQRTGGFRSIVGVPLMRDGFPIGVISVWRRQVQPFTEREIDILEVFADQAVIAVQNVQLFRALQRQTEELSRYVSPQVASLIASDQGQQLLAGHRRQIAVLFCDLRGFTSFSETAEPEEVFGVLREYHDEMGSILERQGGTLAHFAGDGMMIFFNDPIASNGFELEAVRAAVQMRDRFAELAGSWRKRGYELQLGIGVSLGYATLGRIGFEGRYHYDAVGNVVILASRLSDEAQGGQILISQRLHAAIEAGVTADPVPELHLKGFSRPVPAYNVTGLA